MTTEDKLIGFWREGSSIQKYPGSIIAWIKQFRYVKKSRRGIVWREAIRDLPSGVKEYLREWREKLRREP